MTDQVNVTPLPYQEITDPKYAERVSRDFSVEQPDPGTLVLRGPCPRCDAVIDIPLVDMVYRAAPTLRDEAPTTGPTPAERVEPMLCTCEDDHPQRPPGRYGCGAYWTLTITTAP